MLFVSVGGTPEQTVKSIQFNKPQYIIFFCSKETYGLTKEVINKVEHSIDIYEYERIVTDSPEDIGKSYRVIVQRLAEILEIWDMRYEDVIVDYTGGTKAMTSAVVLATISHCNKYSYIGGVDRTKKGVGIVIDGKEKYYYQENPWNELAINELNVIDSLFEKARYASVVEQLENIKNIVDIRLADIYEHLSEVCKAYYEWDCFRHQQAKSIMNQSYPLLKRYLLFANNKYVDELVNQMEKNYIWLVTLTKELFNQKPAKEKTVGHKMMCIDLISNAVRRAEKENKYDDAVARLYSAIEKLVKIRLLENGIDNSCTTGNQIPISLKKYFDRYKYYNTDIKKECYKYGFNASCQLLAELDDDFAPKYFKKKKELEKLMKSRNKSILAHGVEPVSKDLYERMLDITMEFAQISKEELVEFPQLNVQKWGKTLLKI